MHPVMHPILLEVVYIGSFASRTLILLELRVVTSADLLIAHCVADNQMFVLLTLI